MQNKLNKFKISPFPTVRLFLIFYLFLNLVGVFNLPIYSREIDVQNVLKVFFLGILGFSMGVLILRGINVKFKKIEPNQLKSNNLKFFFLVINLFTFLLVAYTNVRNGGIIILSEDSRFTTFAITNLFVFTSIVITIAYYANRLLQNNKIGFFDILFLLFQSFLFLSLGYRSPLISLLGGLFVVFYTIRNDYQNKLKKIFSWKVILGALVFLILMSSIASFRVSRKYDVDKFYKNINIEVLKENTLLKPFIPTLALFRHDQEVIDKLIEKRSGKPMYMGLALSNVLTLLPGEQLGARNIIGDIIQARKNPEGKPWSITPTLQGAFFVDGGYLFVFIGFFFTAIVLELLRKLILKQQNPFVLTFYGLMVVAALKCIHTGYVDAPFFIILILLFILKFLVYNVNYSVSPKN